MRQMKNPLTSSTDEPRTHIFQRPQDAQRWCFRQYEKQMMFQAVLARGYCTEVSHGRTAQAPARDASAWLDLHEKLRKTRQPFTATACSAPA